MKTSPSPENSLSRAERRRRSGVKCLLLAAGILAMAVLLYIAVYRAVDAIACCRRAESISHALQNSNIEQAAALLEQTNRENPRWAKRRNFAVLRRQLHDLQQKRVLRRQKFVSLVKNLEAKLFSSGRNLGSGEADAIFKLLTQAALHASTPEEFFRVQELQKHCEVISKNIRLQQAQQSVAELKRLEKNLQILALMSSKNDFPGFKKLAASTMESAGNLSLAHHALPEIAAQAKLLRENLQKEIEKVRYAEKLYCAQEQMFQQISSTVYPAELIQQSRQFLQQYPASHRSSEVKNLLTELQFIQRPHLAVLQKQQTVMYSKNLAARRNFLDSLQKILNSELQGTLFELVLQLKNHRIKRFETFEKTQFKTAANGQKIIKIKTADGSHLQGCFNANGSGEIICNGFKFTGKLINCRPEGELPNAFWQEFLYELEKDASLTDSGNFPEFLSKCRRQIKNEPLLPETLQNKLLNAIKKSESSLGCSAEQFIFSREILRQTAENPPVFAGLIKFDDHGIIRFYPVDDLRQGRSLYLVELEGKRYKLKRIGKWSNNHFTAEKKFSPPNKYIHAVFVPEAVADYRQLLAKYRQAAAEKSLQLPPLPDFMSADTQ